MDVGALPVMSFIDGTVIRGEHLVTPDEVKQIVAGAGNLGVEGSSVVRHSLHLCSTIVHPISRELMGCTVKVGRSVVGLADVFDNVVGPQTSVLLLGEFCTGKTVLLRDMARRAAGDSSSKLVAVVDTTGELGGLFV
jgi:stage III sporulation protein SpoIIIAA